MPPIRSRRDHLANQVHHFDIPGRYTQLKITAQALVFSIVSLSLFAASRTIFQSVLMRAAANYVESYRPVESTGRSVLTATRLCRSPR